ncbi:MAG: hypothetical protein FJY11_10665 [Bacteroidetes bacterium]|nr:hypothetical protein [Bacteroidota bacterium]
MPAATDNITGRFMKYLWRHAGILLALWFVAVLVLSVIPGPASLDLFGLENIRLRLDYIYHIAAFFTGAALALLKLYIHSGPRPPFYKIILTIAGITLFSVFHEYIQLIIPYRSFNINDIIANLFGVFSGSAIIILIMIKPNMTIGND